MAEIHFLHRFCCLLFEQLAIAMSMSRKWQNAQIYRCPGPGRHHIFFFAHTSSTLCADGIQNWYSAKYDRKSLEKCRYTGEWPTLIALSERAHRLYWSRCARTASLQPDLTQNSLNNIDFDPIHIHPLPLGCYRNKKNIEKKTVT